MPYKRAVAEPDKHIKRPIKPPAFDPKDMTLEEHVAYINQVLREHNLTIINNEGILSIARGD